MKIYCAMQWVCVGSHSKPISQKLSQDNLSVYHGLDVSSRIGIGLTMNIV